MKRRTSVAAIFLLAVGLIAGRADAAEPSLPTGLVEGKRITVLVEGDGPDVVLIPGLSSPRAVWDTTAERLKSTHTGCTASRAARRNLVQRPALCDDARLFPVGRGEPVADQRNPPQLPRAPVARARRWRRAAEISLRLSAALASEDVQVALVKGGDHRLSRETDIALLIDTVARIATH